MTEQEAKMWIGKRVLARPGAPARFVGSFGHVHAAQWHYTQGWLLCVVFEKHDGEFILSESMVREEPEPASSTDGQMETFTLEEAIKKLHADLGGAGFDESGYPTPETMARFTPETKAYFEWTRAHFTHEGVLPRLPLAKAAWDAALVYADAKNEKAVNDAVHVGAKLHPGFYGKTRIAELENHLAAKTAALEKAKEALKPFAGIAKYTERLKPETGIWFHSSNMPSESYVVTVQHVRDAARAASTEEGAK